MSDQVGLQMEDMSLVVVRVDEGQLELRKVRACVALDSES